MGGWVENGVKLWGGRTIWCTPSDHFLNWGWARSSRALWGERQRPIFKVTAVKGSYQQVCWLLENQHFLRSWRFCEQETVLLPPTDPREVWSLDLWSKMQTHQEILFRFVLPGAKLCTYLFVSVSHRQILDLYLTQSESSESTSCTPPSSDNRGWKKTNSRSNITPRTNYSRGFVLRKD